MLPRSRVPNRKRRTLRARILHPEKQILVKRQGEEEGGHLPISGQPWKQPVLHKTQEQDKRNTDKVLAITDNSHDPEMGRTDAGDRKLLKTWRRFLDV